MSDWKRSVIAVPEGALFYISARAADGLLLRKGPYRFVWHPMYSGASLLLLVTIVSHLSVLTARIGALVVIIIPWRIHLEEALLKSTYPDYAENALKAKKLIPFIY